MKLNKTPRDQCANCRVGFNPDSEFAQEGKYCSWVCQREAHWVLDKTQQSFNHRPATRKVRKEHKPALRFRLVRDVDETGISGTGVVAQGVMFGDGHCAMRWNTETASTAVYDDIADVEKIHGHNGKTRIEWVD